jgi:hypothetical protein
MINADYYIPKLRSIMEAKDYGKDLRPLIIVKL